jgi:ribosomal protein S18 acetylase RimI-like enzyme
MLTCKPAQSEQYDEFFQLMQNEAADYLLHAMELMRMTPEQAKRLFKTVGKVYGIYHEERLAGFYWIEERERILHLHGLVLRKDFQGKGIGTQVLNLLETEYMSRMEAIELGVHQSNERAKLLYERLGYRKVNYLPELGFYILQKPLLRP